jgi:hypothetical protein
VEISSSVKSHQKVNKNSHQKNDSSGLSLEISPKMSKTLLSISLQGLEEKSSMSRFFEKKKETISELEYFNKSKSMLPRLVKSK